VELCIGHIGQHEIIFEGLRISRLGNDQFINAVDRLLPAFQSIHKLSWCLQAFAHEMRLLLYHRDGIVQQSRLIFNRWRAGHGDVQV
jgi:hypothetical protein